MLRNFPFGGMTTGALVILNPAGAEPLMILGGSGGAAAWARQRDAALASNGEAPANCTT